MSVVIGALVAATALLLAWPATGVTRAGSAGPATPSTGSPVAVSPTAATSAPRAFAGVVIVSAATASTVLAGLDQFRERAFAEHDAGLLAQVYVSGELLREDSATLDDLVGPACTLVGARTDYRNVQLVSAAADKIVVDATATLAASVLTCVSAAPRTVAGVEPSTLRIELTRTEGGSYLISSLQRG